MVTDFAFDFRATAGFVSDPNYAAPVLGELYPHSYANALGSTIIAGCVDPGGIMQPRDRNNANDPRLAGTIGNNGNTFSPSSWQFEVTLPSPGKWSIVAAFGDASGSGSDYITFLDDTTGIVTYSALGRSAQQFNDASGNVWSNTNFFQNQIPLSYNFSSTTVRVNIGPPSPTGSLSSNIAHLRITFVPPSCGSVSDILYMDRLYGTRVVTGM